MKHLKYASKTLEKHLKTAKIIVKTYTTSR
jgi:hypothetical protein